MLGNRFRPVPPDSAFDTEQLTIGTRVEMEHTLSVATAKKIAKHHLLEDRDYYRKLSTIHLDEATTMNDPCIYCAPSITVDGAELGATPWTNFVGVDWWLAGIGAIGAVGGLAIGVSSHRTTAKVAAGVGALGGLGLLGLALYRLTEVKDVLDRPTAYAHETSYGQRHTSGAFAEIVTGAGILSASAIALLVAGRE